MRALVRAALIGAVGAVGAAAACGGGDSTSPGGTRGAHVVDGANVSDTVSAILPQALIVEVRDSSGALASAGVAVRFTAVPKAGSTATETLVAALTSSVFGSFASAITDHMGRASVLVRLGSTAGAARVAIAVPQYGYADTARYTILPGAAVRVIIAPSDTTVFATSTFSFRGGVVDQYGNTRSDPVTWTVSGTGATIAASGSFSAATTGRYAITAKTGSSSSAANVSVVPRARLAVVSSSKIILSDFDGGNQRVLTGSLSDGGIGIHSTWMPSGASVVFTSLIGPLEVIQLVDTLGTITRLFPSGIPNVSHMADPAPTADGKWLYFSAYDSACSSVGYCLYRSRIDGTAPQLIGTTSIGGGDPHPSPSPDGSRVAFQSGGFASNTIRVLDVATKTLSSWTAPGSYAAWSPDGTQIAATTQFGGAIVLVNPDGTGLRNVTSSSRTYVGPICWLSDNRLLVARSTQGMLDLVDTRDGTFIPLGSATAAFLYPSVK